MQPAQRLTLGAALAVSLLHPLPGVAGPPSTPDGNAVTLLGQPPRRPRFSWTLDWVRHFWVTATVHAAIHDAVNAIERRYEPYTSDLSAPGASVVARPLLLPLTTCSSSCRRVERRSPRPSNEPRSPRFPMVRPRSPAFRSVSRASATLNRRATDGLADAAFPVYAPLRAPWPLRFHPALCLRAVPWPGRLVPWGIDLQNHHAPGPDPLNSLQYALDFNYLKAIGSSNSPWRTADQTEIARFWGEAAPAGGTLDRQHRHPAAASGPMEVGASVASSTLPLPTASSPASMRSTPSGCRRPSTAIQRADEDGNALTEQDADWQPLFWVPSFVVAPPIPDYPVEPHRRGRRRSRSAGPLLRRSRPVQHHQHELAGSDPQLPGVFSATPRSKTGCRVRMRGSIPPRDQ